MAKLKYDRETIAHMSPYRIGIMFTEKEIRAADRKFRRQFRERVKEWEASGMGEDERITDPAEVFLPTMAKSDIEAVKHRLQSLARWLGQKESTVQGAIEADKSRLQTMRAKGFKIKNAQELKKFGKFMDSIRPVFDDVNRYNPEVISKLWNKAKKQDINIVTQLYNMAEANNISVENVMRNFEFYEQNLSKIQQAAKENKFRTRKGGKRVKAWTAREISKELGLYYAKGNKRS